MPRQRHPTCEVRTVIRTLHVDNAVIAQLVEQRLCKAEVLGSNPNGSLKRGELCFSVDFTPIKETSNRPLQVVACLVKYQWPIHSQGLEAEAKRGEQDGKDSKPGKDWRRRVRNT